MSNNKAKEINNTQNIKIDATGKILGRIATNVANLLRGKNKVGFVYHQLNQDLVFVYNAKNIIVTGNKFKQKKYYRHSGYLGNLHQASYQEIFSQNPAQVLRLAVKNMLPKNRLQQSYLTHLMIYNGEINDKKSN